MPERVKNECKFYWLPRFRRAQTEPLSDLPGFARDGS